MPGQGGREYVMAASVTVPEGATRCTNNRVSPHANVTIAGRSQDGRPVGEADGPAPWVPAWIFPFLSDHAPLRLGALYSPIPLTLTVNDSTGIGVAQAHCLDLITSIFPCQGRCRQVSLSTAERKPRRRLSLTRGRKVDIVRVK